MALNLYPAPQNQLSFGNTVGAADLSFGGVPTPSLSFGTPGPAPAASAAPVVPTAGVVPGITTGVGLTPDVANNWTVPGSNTGPVSADGLGWGTMPYMDKAKVVMGGLSTLGSLWNAFQSNRIARDSLDFQKKAYKENLNNQRASYNMALEDRANARYAQMERPDDAAAYIEKHRLG